MNAQLSNESTKSIEEVLRYDHKDADKLAYFRPGGDWEKASEYPQILPLEKYRKEDFLRLAWEILRRSPRYRHQYKRLQDFDIKRSTFSGYVNESYFSNAVLPDFDGWRDISLAGHKCIPKKSSVDQKFGDYIAQRSLGDVWFVMNRRKWVMDLWGLKYLPNPNKNYLKLKNKDLFTAPAGAILVENSDVNSPRMVSTYAGQNEVVFKLRLDAPLRNQLNAIRNEALRLQPIADQLPRDTSDPFSLPRPKRTRSDITEIKKQQNTVLDFNERFGRVLLKQLEFSPLWLRTWDAVQQARITQKEQFESRVLSKHQFPRIDRSALVARFEMDYLNKSNPVTQSYGIDNRGNGSEGMSKFPLYDELARSLQPRLVPNWRERSEKYIEGGDEAYRQLVAMAFARSDGD